MKNWQLKNTLNEAFDELVEVLLADDELDLVELALVGLDRVLFALLASLLGRLGLLLLAPRDQLLVLLSLLGLDLHELLELLVVVDDAYELLELRIQLHLVLVLLVAHEHHLRLRFLSATSTHRLEKH